MKEITDIKEMLKKCNQEHILNFLEELNENEKQILIQQIENIDFKEMNLLYENSKINKQIEYKDISPIGYIEEGDLNKEEIEEYKKIGMQAIMKNELAIITMAGGQGSRLGINGPKGSFVLSNNKSLFEIVFDNINNMKQKYKVEPFWLIMTSKENNLQTREFFKKENYFGYNKDKIKFFKQNEKPILDVNGKLVLENKYTIKYASNGNGDVFESMNRNKIISLLKQNNVKYVYFGGIDNILAKPLDALFLGLMIKEKYEIASKTIFKEKELARTAVFCNINGKPSILGYNHITSEISQMKDENGRYLYRDENILAHLMTIETVEKASKLEFEYHRAYKNNIYLNTNSKYVNEKTFKFEKFIFDAFKHFDKMLLYRVKKQKEFAPIKNLEDIENSMKLYKEQLKKEDL